jgi:glycosyltransferase involved in cell wall biosynthesis
MGSTYIDALRRFAAALDLEDAISLPGSVAVGTLVAYYETADVFVCLSEHEGFCAPIIEAMSRGVPVVAYAAAAVPETVGEAGVLLSDKSPALVASAVHRLLTDAPARAGLVAAGRSRATHFTPDAAVMAFRRAIEAALAAF